MLYQGRLCSNIFFDRHTPSFNSINLPNQGSLPVNLRMTNLGQVLNCLLFYLLCL